MSGGGSSLGKSKGKQSSQAATQLQQTADQLLGEQSGLRNKFIGSLTGLLANKGATPYTELDPSGAIEANKFASAQALQQTKNSLAGSGLLGTPFGEGIVANQRGQAASAQSQIAPQYKNESMNRAQQSYQAVLNLVPQFLTGTLGSITSGLGAAVGGNVKAKGSSSGLAFGK